MTKVKEETLIYKRIENWLKTGDWRLVSWKDSQSNRIWIVMQPSSCNKLIKEASEESNEVNAMILDYLYRFNKELPIHIGNTYHESFVALESKLETLEKECTEVMMNTFIENIQSYEVGVE